MHTEGVKQVDFHIVVLPCYLEIANVLMRAFVDHLHLI